AATLSGGGLRLRASRQAGEPRAPSFPANISWSRAFSRWHVPRTSSACLLPRLAIPMASDTLLKRHFWVAVLLLTSIAGFFDAQGIAEFVGSRLGPDAKELGTPPLAARLPPAPPVASPRATSATPIPHRNAF